MSLSRILTNICSDCLPESRDFYVEVLGFKVKYDSDWYVQLSCPTNAEIEFGIIRRNHELVPELYQTAPTGMYVTFVVPNVDEVYSKAIAKGLKIIQEPRDEFYGQRRFLQVVELGLKKLGKQSVVISGVSSRMITFINRFILRRLLTQIGAKVVQELITPY